MNINNLDLFSIRFLSKLFEIKNVTLTSEIFNLSQPAGSRLLHKLRLAFKDPLLVRTRKGYTLTTKAETLKPLLLDAQDKLDALFYENIFNEKTERRIFRLASTDYGALAILSEIIKKVAQHTQNIQLEILPWSSETLDKIESGEIDCALYAESKLPQDFHFKPLFKDDYVCLVEKNHPLTLHAFPTLENICNTKRIVLLFPEGNQLVEDDILADYGANSHSIALRIPYFSSLPYFLLNVPYLVALPRRIALKINNPLDTKMIELPVPKQEFTYRLIWHERTHKDAGNKWLRSLFTA